MVAEFKAAQIAKGAGSGWTGETPQTGLIGRTGLLEEVLDNRE